MAFKEKSIPVIIYDNECVLCNKSIEFVKKHSGSNSHKFRFVPFLSGESREELKQRGFPENYNQSVVLIKKKKVYTRTGAVLRITKRLDGALPLMYLLLIVPRPVRDYIYRIVAKHRHKLHLN